MVLTSERKQEDTTHDADQSDVREKKYADEENNWKTVLWDRVGWVSAKVVGDRDCHIHIYRKMT